MNTVQSLDPAIEDRHILDQICNDIFVYKEPQMLLEKPRKLIDTSKVNKRDLERYSWLLFNIRYAWEKSKKYEKYFADFYPPNHVVDEIEALNHHIHAYLQDMDTFKNKMETFVNQLKKDVMGKASNKKEIADYFNAVNKKIGDSFGAITAIRNPHTHHGTRFVDSDLLKAENAHGFALQLQSESALPFINQAVVPKYLRKLRKDKKDGFSVAKNRWVKTATKNNSQTDGLLNAILHAIEPHLYQFLNMTPTKVVFRGIDLNKE